MRPKMYPTTVTLALAVGLALGACGAGDQERAEQDPQLGSVDFPTSCSAEAQVHLDRGVALLHHMMYHQAEAVFQEAVRTEEDCAMAHWGVAMSRFQPFWGSADVEGGRAPAERAVELDPPTERERAYARAALAFYEAPEARYGERLRSWEAAMESLHRSFPEDREAAALYALAHLSVGPHEPERQERAGRILEAVYEAEPHHPGANHYSIHVHDVEHRAEHGVRFARSYEDIAPSVPHALHMPSHIYVRLGEWEEVIEWNRRSADAALEFPAGDRISLHYPHAMDYLMYGYLQLGEHEKAREVMEELGSREGYEPHLASAYALAAVPARWFVERRDWAGAAGLEARVPAVFPWDDYPGAEAMSHFARGLGAARTGDPEGARAAVERLKELEEAARRADQEYWARQIEVQHRGVSAWLALAEGRTEQAVGAMRTAAEAEAGMEKHPITPGALQPAYELLGDLLLETNRPAEALDAYETSLDTWPRRYHSLQGAARAAEKMGREEAAGRYHREIAGLVGDPGDGSGRR